MKKEKLELIIIKIPEAMTQGKTAQGEKQTKRHSKAEHRVGN